MLPLCKSKCERNMFNWLLKKEKQKKKKYKKPQFTCKECGYTCNECDLAPICYACNSGKNTFCLNCGSEVAKQLQKD